MKKKIKRFFSNAKEIETSRKNMGFNCLSFYKELAVFSNHRKNYLRKTPVEGFDFTACLIETNAFCNRQCSFCHNNPSFKQRSKGIMDEALYMKIIDELSDLGFSGRISPHGFGEPLMDKRLPTLISYARKKCPDAFIKFNSNGDFLTEELIRKLIAAGLNQISVTNYDDYAKPQLTLLTKKYPFYVKYKNSKDFRKYNRPQKDMIDNFYLHKPCMEPVNKLVINWEGKVIICCQDIYASHCMGDLSNMSLVDIVRRAEFKNLRKTISEGCRSQVNICRKCDHE